MIAKKIIFQNLSITVISKIFAFILFLFIAKVLSTTAYGSFVYITMMLSLLPLLQFGSMHGAVILLPRYIADKTKDISILFDSFNNLSHLLQLLSVLLLFLLDLNISVWIVGVIALNFMFSKHIENTQLYLSASLRFYELNILKSANQVLKPMITLLLFYQYRDIESIFVAQLIGTLMTFSLSLYYVGFKLPGQDHKSLINTIKVLYKIGFFVYLVWVIDILFRTADRWFISQFYSLDDLAVYGFTSSLAMNIWLVSMSFFAPYAQLLYKNIAEKNFFEVKRLVESTNRHLYILLSIISSIALLAYPYVIELIVHKYFNTDFLFFVLVLSSILLALNNMYIYYMISSGLHFILLRYQVFILLINLILNSIFSFYQMNIVYFAYSTIVSLGIYYILVRRYFYHDIEKRLCV